MNSKRELRLCCPFKREMIRLKSHLRLQFSYSSANSIYNPIRLTKSIMESNYTQPQDFNNVNQYVSPDGSHQVQRAPTPFQNEPLMQPTGPGFFATSSTSFNDYPVTQHLNNASDTNVQAQETYTPFHNGLFMQPTDSGLLSASSTPFNSYPVAQHLNNAYGYESSDVGLQAQETHTPFYNRPFMQSAGSEFLSTPTPTPSTPFSAYPVTQHLNNAHGYQSADVNLETHSLFHNGSLMQPAGSGLFSTLGTDSCDHPENHDSYDYPLYPQQTPYGRQPYHTASSQPELPQQRADIGLQHLQDQGQTQGQTQDLVWRPGYMLRPQEEVSLATVEFQDLNLAQLQRMCDKNGIDRKFNPGKPELIQMLERNGVQPMAEYRDLDRTQLIKMKAKRGMKHDKERNNKAHLIAALQQYDQLSGTPGQRG